MNLSKDETLNCTVLDKLPYFYGNAILPKLAHPRHKFAGICEHFLNFYLNSLIKNVFAVVVFFLRDI